MERLSRLIARARVLPVDIDTIEAVAQLRNECRQMGHGLHQRGHNADLWITATAIRWRIPLVAHDAVFDGYPGLELRTELVPVSAAIADDAAALKAHHRGLSLPEAIALVVAEMIDADAVWTFDRRWRDIHQRVTIP
jgi:PIN domain nuclease of toxin-antitoxin system